MDKDKELIVIWFSCGAASAVAAKKTIERYGDSHRIMVVNNPIKEEDADNYRFLLDIQSWLGQEIHFASNPDFPDNSAVSVWNKRKFMSGIKGAPCTSLLKKKARYIFEIAHKIDWHVLGFTIEEVTRHYDFTHSERENVIPILIQEKITKDDCFKILFEAGIEPPRIYKLGYPNANCIGCVKATSPTYWNHVRKVHPHIFDERAAQSREIGCKLVKVKGKRLFLDQLDPNAKGRKMKTLKMPECSIFCNTD